jgi:hypothetical protein
MHSEENKIIAVGDDTMDDNTIGVSDESINNLTLSFAIHPSIVSF